MPDNKLRTLRQQGIRPLPLLAVLGCFALAGYAVSFVPAGTLLGVGIWFAAAIVVHDLVLFPAYALADRVLAVLHRSLPSTPRVPPVNYVRTPALASALLFVLFLPGIIRQGARTYRVATGLTQQPFLARWLVLTVVAFGISAALYGFRWYRVTRTRSPGRR